MKVRKTLSFLLALSLCCALTPTYAKDIAIKAESIEIFEMANDSRTTFGQLEFLSGLILTSKDDNFGGLSGLRIKDGTIFAVVDQGLFVTAKIIREAGKLSGLTDATISRLRNRKGECIKSKKQGDAEALEIVGQQFLVGFERNHRIDAFNLKGDKLFADERADPISFKKFDLPNNKGPEAIARVPGTNKLLAFAEYAPSDDNLHQAFIIEGEETIPFFVTLTTGYSLTDAAFLPDGNLLMLERFYTPITGPAMRIRKFDVSGLSEGQMLDGEIIMEATSEMEIDNMEGLAITQNQNGETILTLISDDNFSRNQRTVMLEFKLNN